MEIKEKPAMNIYITRKHIDNSIWEVFTVISLLVLMAKVLEYALYNKFVAFDTAISSYIRGFASERVTKITIVVTNIGSAIIEISLMLVVIGYLIFHLNKVWESAMLAASLAGGWLLNVLLKELFHRARPGIKHLVYARGYSFPSGHAMVAVAFYGMLGYLFFVHLRACNKPSIYMLTLTTVLIVAIGISRVYLGVHYPSDVIAGFAAGGVWLVVCIIGLHKYLFMNNC